MEYSSPVVKTKEIPAVHRILLREYKRRKAPIVDLVKAQTHDPFKILVTTILSARTRDEMTAEVARRLFKEVDTVQKLDSVSLPKLRKLIYPIGFFRTKARNLKKLPKVLKDRFDGQIPDTVDDLCRLPGVGRKTANLVVVQAFDKPAICVDVHVHRISNRLGLIATKTPFETEMTLRDILPRRYWKTWNSILVSHGQTICRPIKPDCRTCPISDSCDRVEVIR